MLGLRSAGPMRHAARLAASPPPSLDSCLKPRLTSLLGAPLFADNITLGTACGKMYRTSVLSITDIGDSDIMRSIPEAAA